MALANHECRRGTPEFFFMHRFRVMHNPGTANRLHTIKAVMVATLGR
jgi:hypothetical protein